jgi:hypothetical protein
MEVRFIEKRNQGGESPEITAYLDTVRRSRLQMVREIEREYKIGEYKDEPEENHSTGEKLQAPSRSNNDRPAVG